MDEACEVNDSAIIARWEAPEVLEAVGATFDAIAKLIGRCMVRDEDLAAAVKGITASAFMSATRVRKVLLS